jgi:C1A family cysteine protease
MSNIGYYGDEATTMLPFWKLRNSWGTGWGKSRYF